MTVEWIMSQSGADIAVSEDTGVCVPVPRIHDIAHSLSQLNRFNGHAKFPYSVAQHSLNCARLAKRLKAGPVVELCCLLHDAHEAVTGDVATPLKWQVPGWRDFEKRIELRVQTALEIRGYMEIGRVATAVKEIDLMLLATERRDLMNFDPRRNLPWPILEGVEPQDGLDMDEHPWRDMRAAFLLGYRVLREKVAAV